MDETVTFIVIAVALYIYSHSTVAFIFSKVYIYQYVCSLLPTKSLMAYC